MDTNDKIVKETALPSAYDYAPFFSDLNLNDSRIDMMFISYPKGSYSYLKSSYFKFQPISNQKLNSIEVHIDVDDGNSRVIPGDVVKFDDEYVVKNQDEVKKCRLVWNGEVIGCGTRLYFKHVETSLFFGEVNRTDIESLKEGYPNGVWLFDAHPKTVFIEYLKDPKPLLALGCDTICIGHPHAGKKMVTFGQLLSDSEECFDIQGRHIKQPQQDCKCQKVHCINYSCKTCPGSSGSPVIIPSQKLEEMFFLLILWVETVNR
ncbi:hypothetical protein LOTGIDRAFT_166640 [Lottia gigantea]|uniref:Peptidase S1 domain-containing protein n=1 Tax=Lottia gigantea TaxID=225164 RepID=V3ZRF6_LOTGI|nr:hypothetical protein LOTGIDRAFT_166640 [Lottia gigantea]ESO86912.1 hypothetical protein LOTGIDRAFT_166640 [Lottia gigantea]